MRTLSSLRKLSSVAISAAALLVMVQPATASVVIPPGIAVPAGHTRFLVGHARGYQVYGCQGSTWTLLYPWAGLFDDNGRAVANHFAGPTWQSPDNSRVVAARIASANAPNPATAIPWLLLQATSTSGPAGGVFLPTTYIQRVNTTGGVAPGGQCTAGATVAIYYTADYYFYRSAA